MQNTSVSTTPYQIVIGEPSTPLKVQPSIYLNNITNLVFNSTTQNAPSTTPLTTPSVEFMINGVVRNFDIVSAGQGTVPGRVPVRVPAGRDDGPNGGAGDGDRQPQRARVRQELHGVAVAGAVLVGRQRAQLPEQGDVRRQRRRGRHRRQGQDRQAHLQARTGQSQPAFSPATASNGLLLPTTIYGTPTPVDRLSRRAATWAARSVPRASRSSPSSRPTCWCRRPRTRTYVQLQEQGYPTYVTSPGHPLTNAVITTSGSIGQANIAGTQLNSEIKTGFDFTVVSVPAWRGPRQRARSRRSG